MRLLGLLCCAGLFVLATARAEASRMLCTVIQDVETLQILETNCLAVGDTISVRYVYVYISMGASHPWMSGPISFGGAGGDLGGGRHARRRAASRLRSPALQNKLIAVVRKLARAAIPATKVARACEAAAKGVEKALVIRDRDSSEQVVGFTDNDALSIKAFGHPLIYALIYVDGDFSDLVDAQWDTAQGSSASEPGGTLASILLHEGVHACMELAGVGNVGTSALHASHHRVMEEAGVPTCANQLGTTCPAIENGVHARHRDVPSDALPGRSLESLARRRLQFAIKDGTVIEEPGGARALVVGGHAFALDAAPSQEQRAVVGREQPLPSWRGAISEMRAMRDGLVFQEPGGPLITIVGGALFPVPSVDALRAGGWDPRLVRQLWRGALAGLPTSPRDGTLVWEEGAPSAQYVIYGGAKLRAPTDPKLLKAYGLDGYRARRLWPKATEAFPLIPIDGTVFRTGLDEIFVVRDRQLHRVESEAALGALGLDPKNARVIWPEALAQIPRAPLECRLELAVDKLDRTRFQAGEAATVSYHVTNHGPGTITRLLLGRTFGPPVGLARALPPGTTIREQLRLDEVALPLGKHTLQLRLASSDCKSTGVLESAKVPFEVLPNDAQQQPGADLVVTAAFSEVIEGQRKTVSNQNPFGFDVLWHVTNAGRARAMTPRASAIVSFKLDGQPWTAVGTRLAKLPLAAGARVSGQLTVRSKLPLGPHTLEVNVEAIDGELRHDNNAAAVLDFDVVP